MTMQQRRTLLTLYAINFLNAVGMWFFLPLLPIFLGRRGGSAALVGVVFAVGLVANAAIRYPAGWAADRFGTRATLVASMLATAALFLAYLLYGVVRPWLSREWQREIEEEIGEEPPDEAAEQTR